MVPQEKIEKLVNALKGNASFAAVVGDKLFPLVAEKGTVAPWVNYTVGSAPFTKDGRQHTAGLQLYFASKEFKTMMLFANTCMEILEGAGYEIGIADADYTTDFDLIFVTINFNLD